jgi:hypothetical protein
MPTYYCRRGKHNVMLFTQDSGFLRVSPSRRTSNSRFPSGLSLSWVATPEVYKTALKNELVKLGISPSQASEAVNALWKEWGKKDAPEGWKVYAVLWPRNDNWIVALCLQKLSGGPLYKFGKSKSAEEMELPNQTYALIPISDVFDRVSSKLSELLDEAKNHEAKGKT